MLIAGSATRNVVAGASAMITSDKLAKRYGAANVYQAVASQTPLRETLWLRAPDPSSWLLRNQNFTISTAVMSIAGYTIGLGDRHPSNIMIQRHTGKVIHIDFGDSFETTMNRVALAERVPFRIDPRMIARERRHTRAGGVAWQ